MTADLSSEYGRCTHDFFLSYYTLLAIESVLHAQDFVKFCHTLQTEPLIMKCFVQFYFKLLVAVLDVPHKTQNILGLT